MENGDWERLLLWKLVQTVLILALVGSCIALNVLYASSEEQQSFWRSLSALLSSAP